LNGYLEAAPVSARRYGLQPDAWDRHGAGSTCGDVGSLYQAEAGGGASWFRFSSNWPPREKSAELGYWHEPDKLIGYCVTIYFAKLLVWDKVLGLGSTDPLAGFAAITANLVVSFYFAKRGFENVARIIKR
jgi:hypothetical protein